MEGGRQRKRQPLGLEKWQEKCFNVDMKILEMDTEKLVPYENNPRKNDGAVDACAASIKSFGFKVPIVIDKNNIIVAGHTRLKAAKKLGLKTVPCVVADDLTPEQIRAFRIVDNKVAEAAAWDYNKLAFELGNIDIDLSAYNFEPESPADEGAFGTDFQLPSGEKGAGQMTFVLAEPQKRLIEKAIKSYKQESGESGEIETFGNINSNGNALYGLVKQWVQLKKLD